MTHLIPVKAPACATCDDYERIPGPDGMLRLCPDCQPAIVTCPVHSQVVTIRDGVLVGRCWQCAAEAAKGLRWLTAHPYKRSGAAA